MISTHLLLGSEPDLMQPRCQPRTAHGRSNGATSNSSMVPWMEDTRDSSLILFAAEVQPSNLLKYFAWRCIVHSRLEVTRSMYIEVIAELLEVLEC